MDKITAKDIHAQIQQNKLNKKKTKYTNVTPDLKAIIHAKIVEGLMAARKERDIEVDLGSDVGEEDEEDVEQWVQEVLSDLNDEKFHIGYDLFLDEGTNGYNCDGCDEGRWHVMLTFE